MAAICIMHGSDCARCDKDGKAPLSSHVQLYVPSHAANVLQLSMPAFAYCARGLCWPLYVICMSAV